MDEKQEVGTATEAAPQKDSAKITASHWLEGTLVYGGPMTRKWKKCLEWVRSDITEKRETPIKREVFQMTTPLHWVFFYHPTQGRLIYDLRDMVQEMTRE